MGIILHSSLNLKNTTIQYAQNIISLFPHRYHRYYHNNLEGIWKCILLNIQSNPIKLQLVDLTYDRPRGKNVSFESPILFISLQELGRDVAMEYKLKWKTSVIFCVLIFLLFSLFSFGMGLWSILYLSAEKNPLFCW